MDAKFNLLLPANSKKKRRFPSVISEKTTRLNVGTSPFKCHNEVYRCWLLQGVCREQDVDQLSASPYEK